MRLSSHTTGLSKRRQQIAAPLELGSSAVFIVTLSFLFTALDVLADASRAVSGFLLEDSFLLGTALVTAAEASGRAARITSGF